jgi:hypothetical protein
MLPIYLAAICIWSVIELLHLVTVFQNLPYSDGKIHKKYKVYGLRDIALSGSMTSGPYSMIYPLFLQQIDINHRKRQRTYDSKTPDNIPKECLFFEDMLLI